MQPVRSGILSTVEAHGHLLAWSLLLCWALLTGGIRQSYSSAQVQTLAGELRVPASTSVNLATDPASRLALIEGIGSVTAGKIIQARRGVAGYLCLCQVMRVPGVPDRPLQHAGPWLLPKICPNGRCRNIESQMPAPGTSEVIPSGSGRQKR
jgi:hypothetical protein